jgi:rSAM/selenodomain-associated transferase 2
MQLSIIIPTLNEVGQLAHTLTSLQSLRRQRKAEVIVVDGGSTDGTVEIAKPLVDHVINASQGRATQMNAGAKVASGALLIFLHADTTMTNAALAKLLATDKQHQWGRFNVLIDGDHWMLRVIAFMMNHRSRITKISTGDQAMFVARKLFDRVGGFSTLKLMEDIDMSRKLKALAPEAFIAVKEPVHTSGRRWLKHGVFRTIGLMWSIRFAYWLGKSPDQLHARYYPSHPR